MLEIYKREIGAYYKGLSGWLFGAAFLFFVGLYIIMVNFNMAYPNFEYTLNNIAFVYIILIPVLTMRSFSEERKQKTDKLLYSLPIKMSQVLLGKYLALITVLVLPVAVMLVYPLILKSLGATTLSAAYASIFGFWLLGATLTAIGMFISSLTENLALAAGGSFTVFLLIYFGTSLSDYLPSGARVSFFALCICWVAVSGFICLLTRNLPLSAVILALALGGTSVAYARESVAFVGLMQNVAAELSLFSRYYEYANGVLDLRTVLYNITVIGIFLYLTELSLERRRWS